MSSVGLARPTSNENAVFGGTFVGTTGTNFFIKAFSLQTRFFSPAVEATGDGDSNPCFLNSGYLYSTLRVQGAMIESDAIGVANIVDTTKNPTEAFTIQLSSGRKFTYTKLLIEAFVVDWQRRGAFVGVAMIARATETAKAAFEAA